MLSYADELRLLFALALNAGVFACAYRFARRGSAGGGQRLADAFLAFLLVQYLSVCLPGLVGLLSFWTMSGVAAVLAGGLWLLDGRSAGGVAVAEGGGWRAEAARTVPWFGVGFILLAAWHQRFALLSEDALTYHLPAAVRWLRTGRLELFPTWYFNPANTYSPLAGSAFIAWLMAPVGNDLLAQFVQVPALLMIGVVLICLGQELGATPLVAALVATATVLARPFIGEMMAAKDDLFLSAFFLAAVVGLTPQRLRDPLGPWRLGVALGLMLATKYTALMTLPIFLLLIDAPFRAGWRWRKWGIAVGVAAALAGPWYVRNAVLTANPVFPLDVTLFGRRIFAGLFSTSVSPALRDGKELVRVFVTGYFGLPWGLWAVALLGWAAGLILSGRRAWSDPIRRACLLGPAVGMGLFLLASPYPEVRFVFPSLLLLLACGAMIGPAKGRPLAFGAAMLAIAAGTAYASEDVTISLVIAGLVAATAAWLWPSAEWWKAIDRNTRALGAAVAGVALLAAVYVYWHAYIELMRGKGTTAGRWGSWGPIAQAWGVVREQPETVPPDAPLAYVNTHLVYPLMGFDLARPVVYVPVRDELAGPGDGVGGGAEGIARLPHFSQPVAGEQMIGEVTARMNESADEQGWLRRLKAASVRYLFIARGGTAGDEVPELRFVRDHPERFRLVFDNAGAVIYEVRE